jgi:hypothetical protein
MLARRLMQIGQPRRLRVILVGLCLEVISQPLPFGLKVDVEPGDCFVVFT